MLSWVALLNGAGFTFAVGVAEPKVYKSYGAVVVDEQVFWFEITVDDIELVNVLYPSYNLLKDSTGLILGYSYSQKGYFLHLTI